MKILFIGKRHYTNRDALTEKYGRIYQLPLRWAGLDATVTLWLIDYHGTRSVQSQDERLSITSSPVKTGKAFWDYFRFRRESGFDIVIASGDTYIGYLGYQLAKKLRSKFVFDVYDKYDEFGGYVRPLGFDLLRFLIDKADACFYASAYLMRQIGNLKRDHVALNGIDEQNFRDIDPQKARTVLGLDNNEQFVGYFGSMEPDRGVQDLVDAVSQLRAQGLNIKALIGGKPSDCVDLHSTAVHYLGNLPFERVPYALASCNVVAIPYRRSPFMDAGASNKIAEVIACRRPIVATRSPNLTSNFPKQAKLLEPYMAEPSQPNDLARVIASQFEQGFILEQFEGIYWSKIAGDTLVFLNKLMINKTEIMPLSENA